MRGVMLRDVMLNFRWNNASRQWRFGFNFIDIKVAVKLQFYLGIEFHLVFCVMQFVFFLHVRNLSVGKMLFYIFTDLCRSISRSKIIFLCICNSYEEESNYNE